jgi:hypothetical protein
MSALMPSSLLADMTDKKLLQTVALIDRLPERGAVDDVLVPLRPRLQRLRPPRPLTLRRVLTFPLEELLVPASAWRPGSLRLSRDLLGTIHELALAGLDAQRKATLADGVAGHTMHDKAVIFGVGKELWPAAATALEAALTDDAAADSKGRNRRQQLALAVELLRLGIPLAAVFLGLPAKPVRRVDDDQRRRLGKLLQALEEQGGRGLALGSEALGQRLGDPAVLLEVLQQAGDGERSAVRIAATGEAGRRVVTELADAADRLRGAGQRSAVDLAEEAVQLVGTLGALESAPADLPVDRAQLKQIARKTAKAVEGHLLNVVNGELLDGFKSLALAPADLDDGAVAAVEAIARAARRLGAAGRQLGQGGQIDLVLKSAFEIFCRGLGEPGNDRAEPSALMDQLRVVEIVFGADAAADLLAGHPSVRLG